MSRQKTQGLIALLIVVFLLAAGAFMRGCSQGIDTTDYRAVGKNFVLRNSIIAREIGKVESLDHFGDGGDAGDVSYNIYRLSGTKKTAVCTVTLRREASAWEVSEAVLALDGVDYRLPVRKADPGLFFRILK